MRLTLVISTLSPGGAEHVLSDLANYWSKASHTVNILTLCGADQPPFYPLEAGILWNPLDVMSDSRGIPAALTGNFRRIARIRAGILASKPDAVISFLGTTNVLVLLATRGLGIPVIVSERSDPAHEIIGAAWQALRRLVYPLAAAVVAQHHEAGLFFEREGRNRVWVIPNAVAIPDTAADPVPGSGSDPFIIGVGRLSREKGFDLLIRAFARLKDSHPDWKLMILGDGPQRQELENIILDLGLQGRAKIAGYVKNPGATMAKASLFVLPSLYEGFPNALCEAMALGVPPVASNCSGGVRDIIRDGENGLLIKPGDEAVMAFAMSRLMDNPEERDRIGSAARGITSQYSIEKVMGQWNALLENVTGKAMGKLE